MELSKYVTIVTKTYDNGKFTAITKRKCRDWEEVKTSINGTAETLKFEIAHEGAFDCDSLTIEIKKLL